MQVMAQKGAGQKNTAVKKPATTVQKPGTTAQKAAATKGTSEYKTTASGIQYAIRVNKGGPKVKEGQYLKLHFSFRTQNDSVLQSTYDSNSRTHGQPEVMQVTAPVNPTDLMEGFQMLGVGDSATFRINSDSIFKDESRRPPFIRKGEFVKVDVKIVAIMEKEDVLKMETEAREKMEKEAKEANDAQIKKDDELLRAYFKKNNIHPQKTASGLYYIIDKPGTGENIKAGDSAFVYYAGKLENGKYFDANMEDVIKREKMEKEGPFLPFGLGVGQQMVIQGWDEGLTLFNKGAQGRLFIPSVMAYGSREMGEIIPANSNLIFDIKIDSIKRGE